MMNSIVPMEKQMSMNSPTRIPRHISLEISAVCNARCIFCPLFHGDEPMPAPSSPSMSNSLFEKCIKEISQWQILPETIMLHMRGELLLDKNFPSKMEIVSQYGLTGRIAIYTNGQFLSPEIAKILCKYNIRTLKVALDSANKEVYEKTRRGCKFETVRDNIIYYSQLRAKYGANTRIQVQHISTRYAGEEDALQLYHLLKPHMAHNDELAVIMSHCWASPWLNAQDYILCKPSSKRVRNACPHLYDSLIVWVDGQVPACCYDYALAVEGDLGNAAESNLLDIWNSEKRLQLHEDIASGDESRLPAYCKHCIALFGETTDSPSIETNIPVRRFDGGFFLIFE